MASVGAVAVGGAGRRPDRGRRRIKGVRHEIKICEWKSLQTSLDCECSGLGVSVRRLYLFAAQQTAAKKAPANYRCLHRGARSFDTPQQAADALVEAAEKFDVAALTQIFGPDGEDIVFTGEFAQDRKHAADFAAEAHEKKSVSVDPKSGTRAFLLVGNEDWPFPVPLVKRGDKWFFDAKAGRQELLYRRIGANELDAIESATATWKRSTNTPSSRAKVTT